jgi:predicted MFS family arabinose efflux permease
VHHRQFDDAELARVLLMRALVGLSLSGLAAVAMTYLSEEIHPQHIGLAMGLYIGGNAIGGMSGRLITGVLIDFVSWHTAMLVIGGLALIAAAVFWKILPNRATSAPARCTRAACSMASPCTFATPACRCCFSKPSC